MAIPGKPSARLNHNLKLITRQRSLRFSILEETPVASSPIRFLHVQQEMPDKLSLNVSKGLPA
jgi:hypothetical protein